MLQHVTLGVFDFHRPRLDVPVRSRFDRADAIFVAMAALAFVVILFAGHGLTFAADEWAFINQRQGWDLGTFMVPHNEHWSAVPILIYKLLLATIGLRSYLPYQVVLVALHLVTAAALYQLIKHEADRLIALAAGGLFLFFGAGAEDLIWPAQIGWNASMAAGALALVLATRPRSFIRDISLAVLLMVAVASSGVGLFFVPVVALAILLTPQRVVRLWVLVPAGLAYAAWFVAYGHQAIGSGILDPDHLQQLPAFMLHGVGSSFGWVLGWGSDAGAIVAITVALASLWRLLGPRPVLVGAVLGFVGLIVQFVLTGLTRVQFGIDNAGSPRYLYTGAFFVLLIVTSWVATQRPALRGRRQLAVLSAVLAVALVANAFALLHIRAYYLNEAYETGAAFQIMTRFGGSPALPATAGWLSDPSQQELQALTAKFGSPVGAAPQPPASVLDDVLLSMVGGGLVVGPAPSGALMQAAPVDSIADATASSDAQCTHVQPTGPNPVVTTHVPPAAAIVVASDSPANVEVRVSMFGTFADQGLKSITLTPNQPTRVSLPNLGQHAVWSVQVREPAPGQSTLCVAIE